MTCGLVSFLAIQSGCAKFGDYLVPTKRAEAIQVTENVQAMGSTALTAGTSRKTPVGKTEASANPLTNTVGAPKVATGNAASVTGIANAVFSTSLTRLPPVFGSSPEPLPFPVQLVTHAVPIHLVTSPAGEVDLSGTGEESSKPAIPPREAGVDKEPPVVVEADDEEIVPKAVAEVLPATSPTDAGPTMAAFDLAQLLATVAGDNPQVAFAGERYREAYARLEGARALWLPSIRAGASYNKHEGTLQASNGVVSNNSRTALNAGLGVQAIGAGSPIVPGVFANFHLRDAIFQPQIANQRALATLEASRAVLNDVLFDTAVAYLDLLRGKQSLAISRETLAQSEQLAKMTAEFARVGQGLQADAARAQTELAIRRNDLYRAEEAIQLSNARLAELLSLDPSLQIEVLEPTVVPIELISQQAEAGQLVAVGLSNRPELAEARHLVCETVQRYEREKYAPRLPSVLLGVSYAGFGGSDGSEIDNFKDRFDFDGVAFWELRNLGLGERAAREETQARYRQERLREVQLMDRVAREILQAQAQVKSRHAQIKAAEEAVASAADSYEKNVARIREGQGLPLETLQSLQAFDTARREYLRVVTDYNEAQFRLQRAVGWPIQ